MHPVHPLCVVLLLALCAACTSFPGADEGRYTATLSGAADTTLTGAARWERGAGLDGFDRAVHMLLPGHSAEHGIFLFFRERPAPGAYRVVNRGAGLLGPGEVSAGAVLGGTYAGTEGEVRITSSRPLRGTFDFVERWAGEPHPVVRIRGEFSVP